MKNCPECGAPIASDAPGGLCIPCMLRMAQEGTVPAVGYLEDANGAAKRRIIGEFELLREIGRGGMGVVYEAHQRALNRHVALKVLIQGEFATETAIKRFQLEAEAAGQLDHPNIVSIYEVGQHEDWPYFAMKLVDGSDLAHRMGEYILRPARPPTEHSVAPSRRTSSLTAASRAESRERQCRIARLLSQVAYAVHFAHQRGILHRDLKPSNILIDSSGQPLVTDFGLAKRVSADGRLTVTGTGTALGSPLYMAPEQAGGAARQISTAADIYSLGVILFELLTGRLPFEAETPLATLSLVADADAPMPRSINPEIAPDLETICLKCLAKNPERRYPSAEELAQDLERWMHREPISARPATGWERLINRARRHPIRTGLAALVLLGLLLAATFVYASARTYWSLMAKINEEHLIVPPDRDGVYHLALKGFDDFRCSFNFWKPPFCERQSHFAPDPERFNDRYGRIEFTNIPPELLSTLKVRVFADVPGLPDPAKTPVLTNGQIFLLAHSSRQERAFYVGSVNFRATNVLAKAPNAGFDIILLGRPGDQDPFKATGLEPHFRY
jgi:serine/threonine protein kinase